MEGGNGEAQLIAIRCIINEGNSSRGRDKLSSILRGGQHQTQYELGQSLLTRVIGDVRVDAPIEQQLHASDCARRVCVGRSFGEKDCHDNTRQRNGNVYRQCYYVTDQETYQNRGM